MLPAKGSARARVSGSAGNKAELDQNSPSRENPPAPLRFFTKGSSTWGARPIQLAAASPSWAADLHFTLEKVQVPLPHPTRQPLTGTCNPRRVSKQKGSPAKDFGHRNLAIFAQGEDGMKKKSKTCLSLPSSPFLSHTPKHRARSPQKMAEWTTRNSAKWRDDT